MKLLIYSIVLTLFAACSSARMVDSWKSADHNDFKPKKILVVGITQNLTARKIFEEQLKNELNERGVDAAGSYDVLETDFVNTKQTEEAIKSKVTELAGKGYDAILISAVKGVDKKTAYSGARGRGDYFWRRFGAYYFVYQDIYFDPGYYDNYSVYHIEASLYNITAPDNDAALVWVASYDIVDPKEIRKTVNDYVCAIMKSMEQEQLIPL